MLYYICNSKQKNVMYVILMLCYVTLIRHDHPLHDRTKLDVSFLYPLLQVIHSHLSPSLRDIPSDLQKYQFLLIQFFSCTFLSGTKSLLLTSSILYMYVDIFKRKKKITDITSKKLDRGQNCLF